MAHSRFSSAQTWLATLALGVGVFMGSTAQAAPLTGTVLTAPGTTAFPGLTTDPAGTLLASLVSPWSFLVPAPTGGVTSGELRSAVYLNTTGTLDFYYQVVNDAGSSTDIARESSANFAGFTTWTGFRTDGSTLAGGIFDDGTIAPFTSDRDNAGIVVGFNFGPLGGDRVLAGTTSYVLVVSTEARNWRLGVSSIIDGGTATVASFQPGPGQFDIVPEPGTYMMFAGGLGLLILRRTMMRRKA